MNFSPLVKSLGWFMFEGAEHKTLEEFLIGNTHFHWVTPWAVLPVPRVRGQRTGVRGALVTRDYEEHTRF